MRELTKIFDGNEIRAVVIKGEPWFVAVDVCQALGLTNVTETMKRLEDDEKSTLRISEGGIEAR